ncbi:MAG TPA: hypothetical protein VEM58_01035, partial [Streptosporangiaceae bacterium]|nr:hypothetical protein [Streptosporangiaceae bacterium]
MRYRLLASYQGAPYEAGVGPDESGVVLFAACPPPEELHFEPATGHWRKEVGRAEVQMLYESRPVGIFRGERCVVLDDLTDRLHITYLGHDARLAERLGYWEVDRGVFELITPRQEVTDIVEQRLPLEVRPDGPLARSGSEPGRQTIGYGQERANGIGPSRPSADLPLSPAVLPAGYPPPLRNALADVTRDGIPGGPGGPGGPGAGLDPAAPGATGPSDVSIPTVDEPPLPLEAEAMRAA